MAMLLTEELADTKAAQETGANTQEGFLRLQKTSNQVLLDNTWKDIILVSSLDKFMPPATGNKLVRLDPDGKTIRFASPEWVLFAIRMNGLVHCSLPNGGYAQYRICIKDETTHNPLASPPVVKYYPLPDLPDPYMSLPVVNAVNQGRFSERTEVYISPKVLSGGILLQMRYEGGLGLNTVSLNSFNMIIARGI